MKLTKKEMARNKRNNASSLSCDHRTKLLVPRNGLSELNIDINLKKEKISCII